MKKLFVFTLISALMFFACKNDNYPTLKKDTNQPTVSQGKGKKGLRARIRVGAAPLIDSCCTFGAVGEVRDSTSVHMEFTQIKTLQPGETFQWIMILEFPPNGLPPVIIGTALTGGNWFATPIIVDYTPDLGVGQYTYRLSGDVIPTYRPIGSNDIVVQLN